MTETLPMIVVGIKDERELLDAIRRYRRLRTYPHAHDSAQRTLHAACERLRDQGLVVGAQDGGSAVMWRVTA